MDKFTFTSPFDYDQFEQSTTIEQLSSEPNQSTNPLHPANSNESEEIASLDRAIQLNNRGLTFARKDAYDLALADFNKGIELDPQEADVYNARGCVYSYKGDYDRAITDYSEAVRLKPDFWITYKNRARVYETIGNTTKAQEDLKKSSELQKQKINP